MSTQWSDALIPWMKEACGLLGFQEMTPVQAACIPLLSKNSDLVVEAVTGSGKTLAFLIPLLIRLTHNTSEVKRGEMQAIIVEPTRELAHQVYKVLTEFTKLSPDPNQYKAQLVVGSDQKSKLEDSQTFLQSKPKIIVATPGRLLDLLNVKHVSARNLDLLVFDEGDRLLDLTSSNQIREILNLLPKQKRCALFSATMNADLMKDIISMGMRNPVKLTISNKATPSKLEINEYTVESSARYATALQLLKTTEFRKAIVYVPTCVLVTHLYPILKSQLEFDVFSLHGKLQTTPRLKTLSKFETSLSKCVLLTTDVAARGLDIPDVDFVLQIDPPSDPNYFVHRAGRTARAGSSGTCALLLAKGLEEGYVDFMKVKGIQMNARSIDVDVDVDLWVELVQQHSLSDRANHDLAVRGFLSYVRWYMKHTASSIFRLESINLFDIAKSLGVLRMPKMPELRNQEGEGQYFVDKLVFDELKYKDKQKQLSFEEQMKSKSKPKQDLKPQHHVKNTVAWSGKIQRKEAAQQRRLKKQKRHINNFESSSEEEDQEDWKELVTKNKQKKRKSQALNFEF